MPAPGERRCERGQRRWKPSEFAVGPEGQDDGRVPERDGQNEQDRDCVPFWTRFFLGS